MKKRNLKTLALNKKKVSSLLDGQLLGGSSAIFSVQILCMSNGACSGDCTTVPAPTDGPCNEK